MNWENRTACRYYTQRAQEANSVHAERASLPESIHLPQTQGHEYICLMGHD
jgi:hypothetical protein